MVLNETQTAGPGRRGSEAVAALLVAFSLFIAFGSIQRGELGVSGHGIVASTTNIQWVVLIAGAITAIEGVVALVMLLRRKPQAARRALYVSAITGIVGIVGTVLSIVALLMLPRHET
jgi:hypothetical protein